MKLAVTLALLCCIGLYAQSYGPVQVRPVLSDPTGACNPDYLSVNVLTANITFCINGARQSVNIGLASQYCTAFGADPTGAVDSTLALTACMASLAPGGINANAFIIVPPGIYTCGGGPLPITGILHGEVWVQSGAFLNGCTPPIAEQSVSSAQYSSGGSITGSTSQTCGVAFSGGYGGTGTVALTSSNTIASGTVVNVTASGNTYISSPVSATLSNGTATCSGTATVSVQLGSNTAIWVKDETSADQTIYGSLFTPNSTSWSAQTFQPCDSAGECAAITADQYIGARQNSVREADFGFNPVSQPLPGSVDAAGNNLILNGGLSTGQGLGGDVRVAVYQPPTTDAVKTYNATPTSGGASFVVGDEGKVWTLGCGADGTITTVSGGGAVTAIPTTVYSSQGAACSTGAGQTATCAGCNVASNTFTVHVTALTGSQDNSKLVTWVFGDNGNLFPNGNNLYSVGTASNNVSALYLGTSLTLAGTTVTGLSAAAVENGVPISAYCSSTSPSGTFALVPGGTASSCTTSTAIPVPIPYACTAGNLYVVAGVSPTSTAAVTLYKNGSASALTCTLTNPATTCNDTSHTVSLIAGDLWAVEGAGDGVVASVRAAFTCK